MTLLLFFAVTSRRGDLEILGYVMLQWLCGRLPWENNLANKEYVGNEKMRYYIYLVYKSMLVCEAHAFALGWQVGNIAKVYPCCGTCPRLPFLLRTLNANQ